nr:hypothetical protein CFP56_37166 [Quercus suber]
MTANERGCVVDWKLMLTNESRGNNLPVGVGLKWEGVATTSLVLQGPVYYTLPTLPLYISTETTRSPNTLSSHPDVSDGRNFIIAFGEGLLVAGVFWHGHRFHVPTYNEQSIELCGTHAKAGGTWSFET